MSRPDRVAPPEAPAVEPKVTWASVAVFVGLSLIMYVLELVRDQPILVTPLPDWLEPWLLSAIPTLLALVAGYRAPHAPRPDLPMSKR